MLVLTRRAGQTINIGDDGEIVVRVNSIDVHWDEEGKPHYRVKLGIIADGINIYRGEVFEEYRTKRQEADDGSRSPL